jgi:integrase
VFLTWCGEHGVQPLAAHRADLELYVRWMQETRRVKPSTVSRRISVVAGFYRTCVIDGVLAHSPAEHVRPPTVPVDSPIQDSGYHRVWQAARAAALTPAQAATPLARRPYDLRHAAVSLWLNSGVPTTEVARRAGHGVAILLKVYANCIDGQHQTANHRIDQALGRHAG